LRAGHGEAVCAVLNLLCDGALGNQQFRIAPIEYPTDVYPEEAPVDDDEEVSADIADTVAPTADEDEDDDYQLSRKEVKKEESKDTKIIESTIDPNAWKVEVEKVAPLLKMRMDADNKEWRTHLEHTKELQENIESKVPMAQDSLGKLSETISQAIEAIRGREKTINSQYKKEVTDYTEVQEQLQEVMKRFDERNREVPQQIRACLPPRSTHMRSGSRAHSDTAS
jgi:intraflagellar transport protein 57